MYFGHFNRRDTTTKGSCAFRIRIITLENIQGNQNFNNKTGLSLTQH